MKQWREKEMAGRIKYDRRHVNSGRGCSTISVYVANTNWVEDMATEQNYE